jgi:AraC-like DNA-binding protein
MLTEILLLNLIYVTTFWAIILLIKGTENNNAIAFLGRFMLIASLVYISHFFYFTKNFEVYVYLDSIYTFAYLAVYPIYHIYTRLLIVHKRFSFKLHSKYLVLPFTIALLTAIGYIFLGYEKGYEYIVNVLVKGQKPEGAQVYMYSLFVIGRVVFISQTIYYPLVSFRLIKQNKLKMQDYYSNLDEKSLDWIHYFNISFTVTSISSALLASLGRNIFLENEILLLFPSIIFSILLFYIGYHGSNQKAFFREIENFIEPKEEGKPQFQLKEKIDYLFDNEKIYKKFDLKIWDITSTLGTNHTQISKVLSHEYGRNFCMHVNHYRVNHAKDLIKSNPNLNTDQIAELSGFRTPSSMLKAFQEFKNQLVNNSK